MKINIKDYFKRQQNKYFLKDITNAKVKIDTDKILSRNKLHYNDNYIHFITSNKDTIFTAKLDVDDGYTTMYELVEDTTEPKWLFHIEDLILVE